MKKALSMIFFVALGAFLMQGFQCASPEMTTAKLAYQNKELDKAKTFLNKELDRNPKNAEAHIIYAEISQKKDDYDNAIKHINLAEKYAVEEKMKTQVQLFKNQLWIKMHDDGVDYLNKYAETKAETLLEDAIVKLNYGKDIKPEMANFYNFLGNSYELKGDTATAVTNYKQYVELVSPGIEVAKLKNIFNGMTREDALKALGKPSTSRGFKGTTDSIIIESYKINIADDMTKAGYKISSPPLKMGETNEVFTFYFGSPSKMVLYGWKVDPPKTWLQSEREQPTTISSAPIAILAQYYFDKKDYDQALNYISKIIILEPENVDANTFLYQIYDLQGKKDEAVNSLKTLIERSPNNKYYRTQYGDFFIKEKQFDKAIEQYEIALKEDPEFSYAVINLASSYKNKAKEIQDIQEAKFEKDKNYKKSIDEYKSFLEKSAANFEKCTKMAKFAANYQVYYELVEIYHVIELNDKRDRKIAELEALEALVPQEEKEGYYFKLIKIFDSFVKNPDKREAYEKKLNKK